MSIVLKCDTCTASFLELDPENLDVTPPEGWTKDELDRDICNFCNGTTERLEAEIPTQEEGKAFVTALKKETRKLNKAKKEAQNGE